MKWIVWAALAGVLLSGCPAAAETDGELVARLKSHPAEDGHTITQVVDGAASLGFHAKGFEVTIGADGARSVGVSYVLGRRQLPGDQYFFGWTVQPDGALTPGEDDMARIAELGSAAFRIAAAWNVAAADGEPPSTHEVDFLKTIPAEGRADGAAGALRARGLKVILVNLEWMRKPVAAVERGYVLEVFFSGRIAGAPYDDLHARWVRPDGTSGFQPADGWAENIATGAGPR